MAHTLDSVLGIGGPRLTVITTFSESFAPWCRVKKESDPGGGERGLSWLTSMESRVSSAAFPKIFTAAKRSLVPSAKRRLSQADSKGYLIPFPRYLRSSLSLFRAPAVATRKDVSRVSRKAAANKSEPFSRRECRMLSKYFLRSLQSDIDNGKAP